MDGTRMDEARRLLRDVLAPVLDSTRALSLGDDDLLALTGQIEALGRLVDAARLTAAGEIEERSRSELGAEGLAKSRGCRSAGELLERVTRASAATARARIRSAVPLRQRVGLTGEVGPALFDRVREAVSGGRMSVDEAAAIVRNLAPIAGRVGVADLGAAEEELVRATEAPASTADAVSVMAQQWVLFLDSDGTLPDEHVAMRERGITLGRTRRGLVPLSGGLLPEVAAQLHLVLDAYLNPRVEAGPHFRDATETEGAVSDDAPAVGRTSAQKRHDALAGILQIAAGHHDTPALGGAAPTLVVTMTVDQLSDDNGVAFLPTREEGESNPVPAAVARQVGCAGAVQRIVFDTSGAILRLGTTERVFNRSQRRAINTRDGGCVIPGCTVPAQWAEVHHVAPWAKGGATHTDNGVLLCWWHHRTIDTSGWEIRMIRGAPWIKAPHWIDPHRRWQPAAGSPTRMSTTLRT